jgi:hypothetical protein
MTQLKDSIFNLEKNEAIAELEKKFTQLKPVGKIFTSFVLEFISVIFIMIYFEDYSTISQVMLFPS